MDETTGRYVKESDVDLSGEFTRTIIYEHNAEWMGYLDISL